MPARSDKVHRLNEETEQYELPYLSKSRVKQWLDNPEHFRLKYLEGFREPETAAMIRGSNIHETLEYYYNQVQDEKEYLIDEGGETPPPLPEDKELWSDFIEPYVSNFFKWESERWRAADQSVEDYEPISVEEEHWRDTVLGIEGEPEWMGLADVILPAASVEGAGDDGVVIVDFKTGSVPDKKYRSPGIYTELEYYVILFEDKYNVTGAAAYYPKEHELLLQPDDPEHREDVLSAAEEVILSTKDYEGGDQFEAKEGPLCGWSTDPDDRSSLYGVCTQCTWNVPVNNENTFRQLFEEGYHESEIADHLGCSENAVRYWRYKLDI